MRRRPAKRLNRLAVTALGIALCSLLSLSAAAELKQCSNMAASQSNSITIVELTHNASRSEDAVNRSISIDRHRELLKDSGQVDCPLLARLRYPAILVSTNPGQKCIPAAQMILVGNNPHNNRWATVAASRVSIGLAVGCVVGNVYVLRTDART